MFEYSSSRTRPVMNRLPQKFIQHASFLLALCLLLISPAAFTQTTTGYNNAPRSQVPGTLLSHPDNNDSVDIGRTTTVQYLRGWVVLGGEAPGSRSGSDLQMRVYNIENPSSPVRMRPSDFGLSYTNDSWMSGNYGWNAHGSALAEDTIYPTVYKGGDSGSNYPGHGPFRVETWGGVYQHDARIKFPFGGWNRSAQAGAWSGTMKWYGSPFSEFEIVKDFRLPGQNANQKTLATFDHITEFGGGEWHPMFFGDLLIYARSGSADSDGIVIYRLIYNDFDDPDTASITPQFVATMDARFEGYWPVFFSDGQGLYIYNVASGLMMAADITEAVDPTGDGTITKLPEYVTDITNASYPVFQDHYAFAHDKKVDMTKFIAGDANPVVLDLDEFANNLDTSQMSLPLGNLWLTGGYQKGDRDQGMGVWVQQQAPDTTRPKVSYHIPQAGRTNYPRHAPLSFLIHEVPRNGGPIAGEDFLVRKVNSGGSLGTSVPGFAIFDMSGVLTFTPNTGLDANSTYQVDFVADTVNQKGFRDAAGNYIEPYTFRFSTGSGVAGDPPPTVNSVTATNYKPQPSQSTTVTVNATTLSNPQYRFNFEGAWSTWGGSTSASHSFATAGRYRVLVQVRDSSGYVSAGSVRILVITPPTGPFPTHSNTMVVGTEDSTRHVWTVNPDSDTVTVVNATTGAKVDEHSVGKKPSNIARDSNGRYWVSCRDSDEIWILSYNGTTNQITTHQVLDLGYGSGPFGVCASPDGNTIFVTLYNSGELARFSVSNPVNPAIIASVPTPRAIAVTGNGQRVFVTQFISPKLEGVVGEYESNGATFQYKRLFKLGYSQETTTGDRAPGMPNYLSGIAIHPNGQHALVTSKQDNMTRGVAFENGDLTHETSVRAIVSVLNLTSNNEHFAGRRDIDNSEGPSAVTFSPMGDMAFIALQGNNRIVGIDALNLGATVNVGATIAMDAGTGLAPQGVLVDSTSKRVFAQNFTGRSVSVFDGQPFLDNNQTSLLEIVERDTVTTELLTTQELQGLQVFYNAADDRMSAEGYISCATCHNDGGHDGRVWDFHGRGEGFRRTTDLRGRAGMGHGNVHWSANFDEIQDFEHDIRGPFGGTGFINVTPAQFASQHPTPASTKAGLSTELDALAAYVTSLGTETVPKSPHRNLDGTMTQAALDGKAVFDAMNCATCHSGSNFTNSAVGNITTATLQNVGTTDSGISGKRLGGATLAGVDTPTLWGLHDSSVFLHHGLAESLDDVFRVAGGVFYQAEDAQEIWTANDVVTVKSLNAGDGGGNNSRGALGLEWMEIKADTSGTTTYESGIRFTNVNGGSGGLARINIRYLVVYGSTAGVVRVNGTDINTTFQRQTPDTGWKRTGWRWLSVEAPLNAGTSNTIEILRTGTRDLEIDAIVVSNASVLANANAHRQVMDLPQADQDDLLAWLTQLDGRDADGNLPAQNLVPATLLTWEFDDGVKTSGQVPPTSKDNAIATGSNISSGTGLPFSSNSYYISDAIGTSGANATSLAGAVSNQDYIAWNLKPASGRMVALSQLMVGVFSQNTSHTFYYELRASADPANFDTTYVVLSETPDGSLGRSGTGLHHGAGVALTADLSGISAFQGLTDATEVEFRIYIWGTGLYNGVGIGKRGATAIDLQIDGAVDDGSAPETAPAITTQPTGTTIYAGQTHTFNGGASGSPTPTIEWFKGSTSVGTGSSLVLSNVTGASAGAYHFVATNSAGNITSSNATLNVTTNTGISGLTGVGVGSANTFVSREVSGELEQATNATGIGSTSDNLKFDFQAVSGDFTAYVNLKSLTNATNARAGLMLRQDTNGNGQPAAGDAFVFLGTRGGTNSGYVQRSRASDSGSAGSESTTQQGSAAIGDTFPNKWVMIERSGDNLNLYTSHDGVTFDQVDTNYTISSLADDVLIGIATWSGASGTTAVSRFDEFNVTSNTGLTNTLDREYWTGISGTGVTNLTSNTAYPNSPTGSDTLTSMEAVSWSNPSVTVSWADSYGQRIRGYIVPETSGNYTFWIAGDDSNQLWLSTDEQPANVSMVAYVSGYSSQYQYTKSSTQKSAPISLVAGQPYYVEILHKEGGGGDNLSVAWSTDSGITPTSANIVPGSVLSAYSAGVPNLPNPINFGSASNFSGFEPGAQDAGTVTVTSDGGTNNVATLVGNAWKSYGLTQTTDAATRVRFSLKVTGTPEIVGIALGDAGDTTISHIIGQGVQLYGDGVQDTWFNTSAKNTSVADWYAGAGAYVQYDMLVSDFAPNGSYTKLILVGDDDAAGANAEISFKDVEFY